MSLKATVWVVVSALLSAAIGVALVVTIWRNPEHGKLLLQVLTVTISWPLILGVLALVFGSTFRREIGQFIGSIGSIRFPGGASIERTTQPVPDEKAAERAPDPNSVVLTTEQAAAIAKYLQELNEAATTAQQQNEFAAKLLAEKDEAIRYWWFMYLSQFLVVGTKVILYWVKHQQMAPTSRAVHHAWSKVITSEEQIETMLRVLLNYGLLNEVGGLLQVTPNGEGFLDFLGPDFLAGALGGAAAEPGATAT